MTSDHTTNPEHGLALTRTGWDSTPGRILLASGRKVAVDWFQTGDARRIRIIDTNYQRIDLLVIPVDHPAPGRLPAKAQASPANDDDTPDHRAPDRALDNPPSDVVGHRRIVLLPHGPAE